MKFQNNPGKVINYLVQNGASSRVKIAEAIGISKASITKIIIDLIASDYIYEDGELEQNRVGRKEIAVKLNGKRFLIAGFDLSKNKIVISIANINREIVFHQILNFNLLKQKNITEAINLLNVEINKYDSESFLAIGYVTQGTIIDNQSINMNIKNVYNQLQEAFKIDVVIANNVRAFASYEKVMGEIKNQSFYVKYGPGVGGVFVIENEVLKGEQNKAGDFGHIDWGLSDGTYCNVCQKNNCLESSINFEEIQRRINPENLSKINETQFLKLCKENSYIQLTIALKKLCFAIQILLKSFDVNELVLIGRIFEDEEIFKIVEDIMINDFNLTELFKMRTIENYETKRELLCYAIVMEQWIYY